MNFISFAQLHSDVAAWEKNLPSFDIVTGIPRSGLMPAAYIALRRNLRYVEFQAFIEDPHKAVNECIVRRINPLHDRPVGSRVLIVDDSAGRHCNTIDHYKAMLTKHSDFQISFAVVYAEEPHGHLQHYYRLLSKPRIFEWNLFRHSILSHAILDIDGVVCEDWKITERDGDPTYLNHVRNCRPLHIPQLPVLGFATARLEKYREHTANWLARHGIRYSRLHMYDAATAAQRRKANDVAMRKAQVYASYPLAKLFIESDRQQAEKIFDIVRKPVLCTDSMQLFRP